MKSCGIGILMALVVLGLTACSKRPSYVLSPKKMSMVLADLHIGESVVDMNHMQFGTDSAKMALKQSIFAHHGIDQARFDTSMVWYAHHMDKYMDVCDREIKLLEERNANAGTLMMEMAMSLGGDSVDVWGGARYAIISDRFPTRSLIFDIPQDENMETGDYYIWRLKILETPDAQVQWSILANYADSTCEYLSINTATKEWNEVNFYSDSTRQLTRLRGMVTPTSASSNMVYIDSIQLLRKRLDSQKYNSRYRQRTYRELYPPKPAAAPVKEADSLNLENAQPLATHSRP